MFLNPFCAGTRIVQNIYIQPLYPHLLFTFMSGWASSWEDIRYILRRKGKSQYDAELACVSA